MEGEGGGRARDTRQGNVREPPSTANTGVVTGMVTWTSFESSEERKSFNVTIQEVEASESGVK